MRLQTLYASCQGTFGAYSTLPIWRGLEAKLAAASTSLVQVKAMLPGLETQLSKSQAELETAQSRMFHRDNQLAEVTSDYQYILKIRNKKGVSPLLLSRAQKEYESALQSKRIKLGQRVTIRIEALKQHTFHGEVVNRSGPFKFSVRYR